MWQILNMEYLIYIVIALFFVLLCYNFFVMHRSGKDDRQNTEVLVDTNKMATVSYRVIVPLKIQACERLLLFLERIQFPVLVKRVYIQGVSRNDFQFSLLQNVQDEFEHNLAQRLYVKEDTWHIIELAKEEVLQNVNAVFADNQDAEVSAIASTLMSFKNTIAEKAIINIKTEFDALFIN